MRKALVLPFLFCCLQAFAQSTNRAIIYEEEFLGKGFIETNFIGGYEGYASFFEKRLIFPEASYKDQTEGLLLFHFTFNPVKKTIKYQFLTLLDKEIENQVADVLSQIVSQWKLSEDKEYKIYQPIVYSMLPYYPEAFEGEVPEIPVDLPLKFLQPFVLIKSKRIPDNLTLELLAEQEVSDNKKSYYQRAESAFKQFIERGEHESAYKVLNQIIRYNPLNRDYLLARIALEKKLNIRRFQAYDAVLLKDFVDQAANEYLSITGNSMVSASFVEQIESPTPSPMPSISNTTVIEENYTGGLDGFVYDFTFYIKPPAKRSINGVSFFKINIPIEGEANLEFLTDLDKEVEDNITKAFQGGKQGWLKRDSAYHQYVACFYKDLPKFTTAFEEENPAYQAALLSGKVFKVYLNKPEEVSSFISTGMGPVEREQKLNEFFKRKRELRDSLEKAVDYGVYNNYTSGIEEYRALIADGKTKKAFKALNALIRLNPFERFLVTERIRLAEENPKLNEHLEKDRKLLTAINEIYTNAESNVKIDN